MWRALLQLLDEASTTPGDAHGWTDAERAIAREAVAWYRARFPQRAAPVQRSTVSEYQRGRERPRTVPVRSAGEGRREMLGRRVGGRRR
jgi:hypothetical protein